jgi:hypothetical protein
MKRIYVFHVYLMSKIILNINYLTKYVAIICCATIIFSLTVSGQTKPEMIDDFSRPVKENPNVTYDNLIALVFPKIGENTRKSIPLDNIFGDYKAKIYEGNLQIGYARAVRVNAGGRRQLLLLINLSGYGSEDFLWQEMNVLALFEAEDAPKLIDAVDVQGDKLAFFSEQQPILNISPHTDAFLIANHHFNAGESFTNLTLISAVKNRLKIVLGDIQTLKTESGSGISFERKASLKVVPNAGRNYRLVTIDLKYVKHPDGEECERPARGFTKFTRYRYRWDKKRGEYLRLRGSK